MKEPLNAINFDWMKCKRSLPRNLLHLSLWKMFAPCSKDEEQIVRAAIGSVLSRGVKDGSWKGGKGIYYLEEKESAT